jgi:hypothetical protein
MVAALQQEKVEVTVAALLGQPDEQERVGGTQQLTPALVLPVVGALHEASQAVTWSQLFTNIYGVVALGGKGGPGQGVAKAKLIVVASQTKLGE